MEEFQNYFTKGNDDYPANTMDAYNLLVNFNTTHSNPKKMLADDSEKVSFANIGGNKGKYNSYKTSGGGDKRKVQFYYLIKFVQIAREFPIQKLEEGDDAVQDKR